MADRLDGVEGQMNDLITKMSDEDASQIRAQLDANPATATPPSS
jgi:hypothetical protein